MRTPLPRFDSGNCSPSRAASAPNCARACSGVTPGLKRAVTMTTCEWRSCIHDWSENWPSGTKNWLLRLFSP